MFSQTEKENNEETMLRKELAKLDVQRKSMEHEVDAIFLELTTPPDEGVEPMGIDTPLVDQDGYPRGDIDLYRTRTMRRRFRELKTDHKEISKKIESMLTQLAAMKVGRQAHRQRIETDGWAETHTLAVCIFRTEVKKQKSRKKQWLGKIRSQSPSMILSRGSG